MEDVENGDGSDKDSVTMGSFIKVEREKPQNSNDIPEDTDDPDFYDIDVLAWDYHVSYCHYTLQTTDQEEFQSVSLSSVMSSISSHWIGP